MVRTDQAFINEYLVYDEVFEACDVCERVCVEADYLMRKQARQDYLDIYFSEAMNFGKKQQSNEENNIFAKIGKAIANLIEKIKTFIKKIGDAIIGNEKKTSKANAIVQKIIADNPELKTQIIKGVKKEWFTIYDVAAYKNDVIGLINMLDQAKIDNQTALDRFKEATSKFMAGAGTSIVAGAGGVLAIAKCMTEIGKSRAEVSKLSESMKHMAEVVEKDCKDSATKNGKDPAGFQTQLSTKTRILTGAFKVLVGVDKKYNDRWNAMNNVVTQAANNQQGTSQNGNNGSTN